MSFVSELVLVLNKNISRLVDANVFLILTVGSAFLGCKNDNPARWALNLHTPSP